MSEVKLRDYPIGGVYADKERTVRLAVSVEPRPEDDGHVYWRPMLMVESDQPGPTMPAIFSADMPGRSAAILGQLLQDAWDLARSLPEIPLLDDKQGGDR